MVTPQQRDLVTVPDNVELVNGHSRRLIGDLVVIDVRLQKKRQKSSERRPERRDVLLQEVFLTFAKGLISALVDTVVAMETDVSFLMSFNESEGVRVLTSVTRPGELIVIVAVVIVAVVIWRVVLVREAKVGARPLQVAMCQHGGRLRGPHGHPCFCLPHLLGEGGAKVTGHLTPESPDGLKLDESAKQRSNQRC